MSVVNAYTPHRGKIIYQSGCLLDAFDKKLVDVIIHGCNCFCNMDAGIALQIKNRYPHAYQIDCETTKGSRDKLGLVTVVPHGEQYIVNAYTQYAYHSNGPNVDYDAILDSMREVKKLLGGQGLQFGIPKIGAGLAGGNWDTISKLIENGLQEELILCYLPGGEIHEHISPL